MDLLDFSRLCYRSSDRYLNYLKAQEKGKSSASVRKIEALEPPKFKLFLSRKIQFRDALEIKINPLISTTDPSLFQFEVLAYDEKLSYLIIAANHLLAEVLQTASPDDITFESDLTFLVKAVENWYIQNHKHLEFPPYPRVSLKAIQRPDHASDEQFKAICTCLFNPISYVWGAPGTGKTRFVLSNMIYHYISCGQHVLVMAPTNNALEQSLRGVIEVLNEKNISLKNILRLGRPGTEFFERYPDTCQASQYDMMMRKSNDLLNVLKEQLQNQTYFLETSAAQAQFNEYSTEYDSICTEIKALSEQVNRSKQSLDEAGAHLTAQNQIYHAEKQNNRRLTDHFKRQCRYCTLLEQSRRFYDLLSPYNQKADQLMKELRPVQSELRSLEADISNIQSALTEANQNHQAMLQQKCSIKSRISFCLSSKKKQIFLSDLAQSEAQLNTLQQELNEKQELAQILSGRIWATTAQLKNERQILQSSPQIHEISTILFSEALSISQLENNFQKELDAYQDFHTDDQLEIKLDHSNQHLAWLQMLKDAAEKSYHEKETALTELQKTVAKKAFQKQHLEENFKTLSLQIFSQEISRSELCEFFQKFSAEYAGFHVDETLEQQIADAQTSIDSILQNLSKLWDEHSVIACTIDYAILHYTEISDVVSKNIAHIFVDEAAYCSLIKAGVCFSLQRPVTLLGDHMQLPPVCEMNQKMICTDSQNKPCFLWAMSAVHFPDVFLSDTDYKSLFHDYLQEQPPSFQNVAVSFLTKTYRFSQSLAKVLDFSVYHQGFYGSEDFHTSVTVIDAPRSADEQELSQSISEVQAIRQYLQEYSPENYVILTPYRNQRNLLQHELNLYTDKVLTIHASQGREWDTVIISVTDSTRKFFMSSCNHASHGLKIVNTAVSRAKKHLVLVMDCAAWKVSPHELITQISESCLH